LRVDGLQNPVQGRARFEHTMHIVTDDDSREAAGVIRTRRASHVPDDAVLARVVEAWPELPDTFRRRIPAMVEALGD
jgi:hypothetical protein